MNIILVLVHSHPVSQIQDDMDSLKSFSLLKSATLEGG